MGAPEAFLDGRVTLYGGDCLGVLAGLPEASVDAAVTDPPYHLQSIVDRFGATSPEDDNATGARARAGADGLARAFRGFMGLQWDGGDIAFDPDTWRAVARVLKPGGYLIAFSGTRTYHRMACAIEDAGFEVRDMLQWLFATGFPKSHDIGKAIDRAAGETRGTTFVQNYKNKVYGNGLGGRQGESDPPVTEAARQWDGWGTALKPACEPICLARKPLSEKTIAANVLHHGTGALAIDACRIDGRWPANLVHDGEALPPEVGRYFFSAKADSDDRLGSDHPTVKPVGLMRWLVRLVTPPGGVVLDPFAGTGTTGEAAYREGASAVLIEREPQYLADIARRLALVHAGPLARNAAKALRRPEVGLGPLFDGPADDR